MPKGTPGRFEDLKLEAAKRGGKCLARTYVTADTKVWWSCQLGHQWESSWHSVKRGTWCPYCVRSWHMPSSERHRELARLARERGGVLLSSEYRSARAPLQFRCTKGHTFEQTAEQVRRGTWCQECRGHGARTIADMHKLAASKQAICLSKCYRGSRVKLRWVCSEGHPWLAAPDTFARRGCPTCFRARCAGKREPLQLSDLQETARARGG